MYLLILHHYLQNHHEFMQGLEITSDGQNPTDDSKIYGGIVVEGILNPQNYPLNPGDIGWTGLSGLAQGGQPSFAQVASGGSTNWNSGDTATYSTAAVMAQVTTTAQLMPWWSFRTNRSYAYFDANSWEASNLSVGDQVNADGGGNEYFPAGTTIQQIVDQSIYGRYLVYFSGNSNSNSSNGATQTFQKGGNESNSNFAYFLKTVWDSAGARSGTEIGDSSGNPTNQSDISMPSSSYVSNIEGPLLFGGHRRRRRRRREHGARRRGGRLPTYARRRRPVAAAGRVARGPDPESGARPPRFRTSERVVGPREGARRRVEARGVASIGPPRRRRRRGDRKFGRRARRRGAQKISGS